MGSILLALASGFLGGVIILASGVGLARARRGGALRVLGVVTLLAVVALALLSGIAFLWLAMATHTPAVSAFTLGASFGAAVGVAVALVVGLALVVWLLANTPARSVAGGYGAYSHAPLGRRSGRW
ncbi:MAG TPA: hypothetical protein VKQ36_08490 [Ktedonobacterales bacterium]|nr:hypothetical protein [Ktedonobacterales bacterium]